MNARKYIRLFGSLGMSLCMILSLTACSRTSDETLEAGTEVDQRAEIDIAKKGTYTYLGNPYSEGLAWIHFSEKETLEDGVGIVDLDGNVIAIITAESKKFDMDGNVFDSDTYASYTPFMEGYSHLTTWDARVVGSNQTLFYRYCIVDTDGNVVRTYAFEDGIEVLEGRAGYVATKEETSDFDSVGYHYTIYNLDGSVLTEFDDKYELSVTYCGKGIFAVTSKGYYCTQSDSWVEMELYGDADLPVYCEDIGVISVTPQNGDYNIGELLMLSADGDITTISSSYFGSGMATSTIVDNICVLSDSHPPYMTALNLSTGEEYPIPEEYGEKLILQSEVLRNPEINSPHEGRIVVRMEGADGEIYSAVFDTQMNLVFGPVKGYAKAYSDGRLLVEHDQLGTVYDRDGNVVFNLEDKGYGLQFNSFVSQGRYFCGALYVEERNGERQNAYLDIDGNLLFEELNFDNAKAIDF